MAPAAVVLQEEIDKDYEPTDEEIQQYAEWLGIDMEKDSDLLWIAKAGLKAPLPHPWKPCQTGQDGDIFYFNFETGESVWDHPCDDYHRNLYQKEKAKKYGLPYDEADGDGDTQRGTSSTKHDEDSGDGKKSKKDKKEKKEKKDKKERKEKKAPKELAPISSLGRDSHLGVGLGLPLGSRGGGRDEELENSLEESLSDAALKESMDRSMEKSMEKSMERSMEKSVEKSLSKSKEELEGVRPAVDASKTTEAAIAEGKAQIDGEVEGAMAKYKIEREMSERARINREIDEWVAAETQKKEEEKKKKTDQLEADNKTKLAKHRKELAEEFDMERDKIYGELHAKQEKQVREERQRLNQEFNLKQKEMRAEAEKEAREVADAEAALKQRADDAEAECDRLRAQSVELEKSLQEAKSSAEASAKECTSLKEDLEVAKQKIALNAEVESKQDGQAKVLSDRISELEGLKTQLAAKEKECDALAQDKADAVQRLGGKTTELEQLQSQLTSLGEQLKCSEKASSSKEESLEKELGALKSRCEQFSQEAEEARMRAVALQSDLEERDSEIGRLKDDVADAADEEEQRRAALTEELRAAREEATHALEEKEQLSKELQALRSELEGSCADRTRLASEAHDVDGLRKDVARLESDLQALRKAKEEVDRKVQDTDNLRKEVSRLEAELQAAQKANEEVERKAQEVGDLRKEVSRLETELQAAQKAKEEMEGQVQEMDSFRREAARLEKDLQSAREAKSALEQEAKEMEELRKEVSRLEAALQASRKAKEEVERKAREVDDLRKDVSRLETELQGAQEAKEEVEGRAREVDDLRKDVSRLETELQGAHEAKEEVEGRAQELDGLRREVPRLEAELRAAQGAAQEASEALHGVQSQLHEANARLQHSASGLDEAETGRTELSEEVMQLKMELEGQVAKCERAQEEAAAATATVGSATRRSRGLEDERVALAAQLADAQAECLAARERLEEVEGKTEEESQWCDLAKSEAAATAKQVASLSEELDARMNECQRLHAELEKESGASAGLLASLQSRLAAEEAESEAARREASVLKADAGRREGECQRLQVELARASEAAQAACSRPPEVSEAPASAEALRGLRALRVELEEERKAAAELRAEAALSREFQAPRSLSGLPTERSGWAPTASDPPESLRALRVELGEEMRAAAQRQEAAAASLKELQAVRLELDSTRAECSQMRRRAGSAGATAGLVQVESLRAELDEARNSAVQARDKAHSVALEESQGHLAEVQRLQAKLQEERSAAIRGKAEASEAAAMAAELEARSVECGRLQAELAAARKTKSFATQHTPRPAQDVSSIELIGLRAKMAEQRAELERLRHQAQHVMPEERLLRGMVEDRDETITQLKVDFAQAAAAHAQELEVLHMKLAAARAEDRRHYSDGSAAALSELRAQLRSRVQEVESLRSEVRSGAEELRKVEARAVSAEASAAQAAKAASAEQWRREVRWLEESLQSHSSEAAEARELAEKRRRELRRVEAKQMEADSVRQEANQLREQLATLERCLEEARSTLRSEQAARYAAEGQVRDTQHLMQMVRAQLTKQKGDTEVLSRELETARRECVAHELEGARLKETSRSLQADLLHLQLEQQVQQEQPRLPQRRAPEAWAPDRTLDKRGDEGKLDCCPGGFQTSRELMELGLKEQLQLDAHPSQVGALDSGRTGGASLSETQMTLAPELQASMAAIGQGDTAADDSGNRQSAWLATAPPVMDSSVAALRDEALPDGGSQGLLTSSWLQQAGGELAVAMEGRKRELRRERAALEELRRQWKQDVQRSRAAGGSAQAQGMLQDVRGALDERARALNLAIDELRTVDRSFAAATMPTAPGGGGGGLGGCLEQGFEDLGDGSMQILHSARRSRSESVGAAAATWASQHDGIESSLMQRWRPFLAGAPTWGGAGSPAPRTARSAWGLSPRGGAGGGERSSSSGRRRAARSAVDQQLSWLRSNAHPVKDFGSLRPATARGGCSR